MVSRVAWLLMKALLVLICVVGCDSLSHVGTSVAGEVYMNGVPQGGHLTLQDFKTGKIAFTGETQDGHFIISGVTAGEYVLRYMNMRAIPMGGGMYIKVEPGRPVTELKFEVYDIVPPPPSKDKDHPSMTLEEFKKKFDLKDKHDMGLDKGS